MMTVFVQLPCALELGNSWRIAGMLVSVDHPRSGMILSAQRLGQKAFSGRRIARRGCAVRGRTVELVSWGWESCGFVDVGG
jgi:hypothetical protein